MTEEKTDLKKWRDAVNKANAGKKIVVKKFGIHLTKWHVDSEHPTTEDYQSLGLIFVKHYITKENMPVSFIDRLTRSTRFIYDAVCSASDKS